MGTFEKYIRHELSEVARNAEAAQTRRRMARETATSLAALLAEQFGVQRVWLFGSAVTGRFDSSSDIDLACVGLRSDLFFAAWSQLNAASQFNVDLISLESAPEALKAQVLAEGEILFDRSSGEGR